MAPKTETVRVTHGIYRGDYPVAGTSVGTVRRSLRDLFNIASDAKASVDSIEVDDHYPVHAGDSLEFVAAEGSKGLGELLTPEQLQQRWAITREQYLQLLRMGLPAIRFDDQSLLHPEIAVDEWVRERFSHERRARKGRGGRGCDISVLLGGQWPASHKEVSDRDDAQLPPEVTTAEAGSILGVTKDTVLKLKENGLLAWRNAAPPSSSRAVFLFSLESVLKVRTSYEVDSPVPPTPREPQRRQVKGARKYKHLNLD